MGQVEREAQPAQPAPRNPRNPRDTGASEREGIIAHGACVAAAKNVEETGKVGELAPRQGNGVSIMAMAMIASAAPQQGLQQSLDTMLAARTQQQEEVFGSSGTSDDEEGDV